MTASHVGEVVTNPDRISSSGDRRSAAWLAWGAFVISAGGGILWVALGLELGASVSGVPTFAPIQIVFATSGIVTAGVAVLIATRRPDNRTWIPLAVVAAVGSSGGFLGEYAILALVRDPGRWPAGQVAGWLSTWPFAAFLASWSILLLIFPTGRLLSPRWRWAAGLALVMGAVSAVAAAFGPGIGPNPGVAASAGRVLNPLYMPGAAPLLAQLRTASNLLLVANVVTGVACLVQRMRRSPSDERQQLRLLFYVTALGSTGIVLQTLRPILGTNALVYAAWVGPNVILPIGLPLSIGIAILRYRLYDIDIVINRTLVYGALAAFITACYVGFVVGIGSVVGSGGRANLLLSLLATAIVAVAFQPARQRMQGLANRLVYGRRASPYEVLAELSARAAEAYDADEVLPRMAKALAEGTGAFRAGIWVRSGSVLHEAAAWPDPVAGQPIRLVGGDIPSIDGSSRSVAVRHHGELLGALAVSKRPGDSLNPVEAKLLDDIASQAGLVLRNFGLTAELRAHVRELRESRLRLVTAQDAERRRLERDLHDGAQQILVALKVKAGLAEMLADRDPGKVKPLLGEVKSQADEALETLRDLARGIYPPVLAERGLAAALEAHARRATIPVSVESRGAARYPQQIEAAVYFCCLEALQNVQKYASAESARVELDATDAEIRFAVSDDGAGFDAGNAKRGSGLSNMADRIEALGGTLSVISTPGRGTRIEGWLSATTPALS